KYVAVSYAWGASTSNFTSIRVDGYKYIITAKHVAAALRMLRSQHEPVYVWLDCVCINQADNTERGHQVSLMKDVFTQASKVVIWLG
ncbi:heterokaryon incompatibility, partial [Polychaeton citri CBS 116435]